MTYEQPTDEELTKRYAYHAPKNDQAARYEFLRKRCGELARDIVRNTPCSPEQTRALDFLDQVMMLANAAIARRE